MSVSPASVQADGERDVDDHSNSQRRGRKPDCRDLGADVVISATGTGNTVVQPTAATGANGQTSGTIASTVAEAKTVSVTINGVTVTQTKVVTFTAWGTVDGDQSTVSVSPASVQADGSATSTITVTAKDAGGNPIAGMPGASVVISATGTGTR